LINTPNINNGSIYYTYDGGGKMLKKQVNNNGSQISVNDYLDEFVYTNGVLSYFSMPEGRVVNNSGTFVPQYIISDQQGNARLSFSDNGSGSPSILQENSYYSFGEIMPNSLVNPPAQPVNNNLYNGASEWQNVFSNLPDYHQTSARNYDPVLGRFIAIDPLSEDSESLTNYQYAANNPVMNNDITGKDTNFGEESYGPDPDPDPNYVPIDQPEVDLPDAGPGGSTGDSDIGQVSDVGNPNSSSSLGGDYNPGNGNGNGNTSADPNYSTDAGGGQTISTPGGTNSSNNSTNSTSAGGITITGLSQNGVSLSNLAQAQNDVTGTTTGKFTIDDGSVVDQRQSLGEVVITGTYTGSSSSSGGSGGWGIPKEATDDGDIIDKAWTIARTPGLLNTAYSAAAKTAESTGAMKALGRATGLLSVYDDGVKGTEAWRKGDVTGVVWNGLKAGTTLFFMAGGGEEVELGWNLASMGVDALMDTKWYKNNIGK
jgi:RHS repeat-associated protein